LLWLTRDKHGVDVVVAIARIPVNIRYLLIDLVLALSEIETEKAKAVLETALNLAREPARGITRVASWS